MIDILTDGIEVIKSMHSHKWVQPAWLILYMVSLIVIRRLKGNDKYKHIYDGLFVLSIVQIIIVYCPLTAGILTKSILSDHLEYERLTWGLFFIQVIALVMTVFVVSCEDRKKQNIRLVVAVLLIFMASNGHDRQFYVRPSNEYKINSESLELAEYLENVNDHQGTMVVGYYYRGPDGEDIYYGIRRYSSEIAFEEYTVPLYMFSENDKIIRGAFVHENEPFSGHEYMITIADAGVDKNMKVCGYEEVLRTERAVLYRYDE